MDADGTDRVPDRADSDTRRADEDCRDTAEVDADRDADEDCRDTAEADADRDADEDCRDTAGADADRGADEDCRDTAEADADRDADDALPAELQELQTPRNRWRERISSEANSPRFVHRLRKYPKRGLPPLREPYRKERNRAVS